MALLENIVEPDVVYPHPVLTIGSFDGVHRGHQQILRATVESARRRRGTPGLVTFQPHPRMLFYPSHAPNLLTTRGQRMVLLAGAGVEVVYMLRFDKHLEQISALDFVEKILCGCLRVEELVVGHDFRFGHGAEGDFEFLRKEGVRLGFSVRQVPPLIVKGERVSSTLIRERVLQGDLREAEELLGRRYSIVGTVVRGRGIGRRLGFPTANVNPSNSAVPALGVYVAEVRLGGKWYPAAVNIGVAPTLRHQDVMIEAHLLDFSGELAGREIEVAFVHRLRAEKKFKTVDALIAQIRRDVASVHGHFG